MLTQQIRPRAFRYYSVLALLGCLVTSEAQASNVMLAGSGSEKVHSTNIVMMQKDGTTVMTVQPDYQGPLSPFAVIIPVHKDVTEAHVNTIKREFSDRVALVSAPKYAEFWEMDPCDLETPHEQEWQRNMKVSADTAFLGTVQTDPSKKVAQEMLLDVEAKEKKGEYKDKFLGNSAGLQSWLAKKDYKLPGGGVESLAGYEAAGYKFLALDVDVNRMELVGSDRATLSPVRYYTKQPVKTLPTGFGLPSAAKMQELLLYTMVPGKRMQVTNYKTLAAPTNLTVAEMYKEPSGREVNLKERIGELFAAIHDRFLEKNPKTFLLEYAFTTAECGKPCPTEPLLPHELLSLGANVFEADLPLEVRNPEPPPPTDLENQQLEAALAADKLTPAAKKEIEETWENDRKELAARKAMILRNEYVLSRLHYRYDAAGMPHDIELGEGAAISGGNALPSGKYGASDTAVGPSKKHEFQTRYNGLFPNIKVVKCDAPKPERWGKAPREYLGLNKIWVAEDLSRRDRKRIDPNVAVITPVAELGIPGIAPPAEKAPEPVAAEAPKKDEGCNYVPASRGAAGTWAAFAALVLALGLWRRRPSEG